jgi:hypothetical protein
METKQGFEIDSLRKLTTMWRGCDMEIVEVECNNCGKKIYVREEFVREHMFCTIWCMDIFERSIKNDCYH